MQQDIRQQKPLPFLEIPYMNQNHSSGNVNAREIICSFNHENVII